MINIKKEIQMDWDFDIILIKTQTIISVNIHCIQIVDNV